MKAGKRNQPIDESLENHSLTRTDARLVFSMVSGPSDTPIPLTPETQIGGLTLRQIMEHADVGLYLDLKPGDPLEATLVSMLVRTHKAAIDHFNQAAKYELTPALLEVHSRYALKSAALFGLFFDRLEKYREKKLKAAVRSRSDRPVRGKTADEATPAIAMRNGANGRSKTNGTGSLARNGRS